MNRLRSSQPTPPAPGMLLIVVVLWVLCIVSALGVVATTQLVRRDINSLETLRREAAQLQVQWGQYLLEQSTWAAYGRVENAAISELNMTAPTPEAMVIIAGDRVVNSRNQAQAPGAGGQ